MSSSLKKIAVGFCRTLLILIVGCGSLLAYGTYAEHVAEGRADALCRSLAPGTPAAGIRERAIYLGANERRVEWVKDADGREQLVAIFAGATPFSRYICNVYAKNGHVISRETSYLD